MSSYHTSFSYMGKNSYDDFNWHIIHFESGDSGQVDSYLGVESIQTPMYDGTKNLLYGTKYSETAILEISIMKKDGTDFTISDTRRAMSWLTGAKQNSWMDLYIGEEVKYRMLGHVQDAKPYKLDSRIVGLTIIFESTSPYAYSSMQEIEVQVDGTSDITITNESDDAYAYTYINTTYLNNSGDTLVIVNNTIGEETKVTNIVANERIMISDNMMIKSDKSARIFGSSFNFVFPRMVRGDNAFTIQGNGVVTFQYIYPMKVCDVIGALNIVSDPICNDDNEIMVDTLPWARISETPTTYQGYGITNVYSKAEVNLLLADIQIDESELNAMLKEELD